MKGNREAGESWKTKRGDEAKRKLRTRREEGEGTSK